MQGLTNEQVKHLQAQYGSNTLPEKEPPTHVEIFLSQLKSPLVYILIAAAIGTWVMGDHEDTIIIAIAIGLNTILGYYQESKAGDSLQALKQLLQAKSKVLRNGSKVTIDTSEIVPGDLVILQAGEKIPADGIVIESNRLFVMEAMLTGESVAINKDIQDANSLFMGTIVQSGQGIMKVQKIGGTTQMGKIAQSLQTEDTMTPLQKQLDSFSMQLTGVVGGIIVIVIILGLIMGQEFTEILKTGIALAVGAIPEGLLIALTAVLAIGMQRILKRKGLVKNLVSAETLGSVTIICSDKTGTLTQGRMDVVTTVGDEQRIAIQAMILNDEDNAVALATGKRANQKLDKTKMETSYSLLDHIPFSSENKCIAGIVSQGSEDNNLIIVNGAPDYVLKRCTLEDQAKTAIQAQIDEYTQIGYRLVGYARKSTSATHTTLSDIQQAQSGLERLGFVGLSDPVREDVQNALAQTKSAGVKLIVITGDFANTAKHIMHQLGVNVQEDHIMVGSELALLNKQQLDSWLKSDGHVKLFARTKPEQKMRIVNALKENGEVVAMMGDGVNDAPALKKADIGVVVNEATDVAKESADLILLNSSFATIVSAIEEGRGMFDNIRKIILYLMCDAFVQIIAILIAMTTGFPIPITAGQILWINLISDGFPSLALTMDPKRKGLMKEPPRDPKEKLITPRILEIIILVSVSAAIVAFLLFIHVLDTTADVSIARSVAFASFGLITTMYVYSVRTLQESIWSQSPLNNIRLIAGIIISIFLIVSPFIFAPLGEFLDITPIGYWRWYAIGSGAIVVVIIEIFKAYLRQTSQK